MSVSIAGFVCAGCDSKCSGPPAGTFMGFPLCLRCEPGLRKLVHECERRRIPITVEVRLPDQPEKH